LTKDSGITGPARSLALGADAYRLAVDPVTRVLETPGGVMRMAQSRRLFAAVLTGSVALHVLALFILNLLERAPPIRPDVGVEIPVELVSDPDQTKKRKGDKDHQRTAKGVQAGHAAKSGTKPQADAAAKSSQPEKPKDSTAATQKPRPQLAAGKPAVAETKPAPSPAKPAEPPKAEPPKQMAQPEPPKPAPSVEPPNPAPAPVQAAQPPKPAPAAPPAPASNSAPVTAALQPQAAPAAGGQSPYGLMPDNWQAVAVPAPSEDGDEDLSYKTLVFSMLELAKQFPEDARARGARGSSLIQFDLNDDGTVKSVKLLRSSGDTELDVESLAVVERAAPFPKPPPGARKVFAAVIQFDLGQR
jgi:TonB family protein